jgi:hypothetical protein
MISSHVPLLNPNKLTMNRKPQNDVKHLQDQNVTEIIPFSAPVSVHNLEEILSGYPDKNFVSELCNHFTRGVHMVYSRCAYVFRGNVPPGYQKMCLLLSLIRKLFPQIWQRGEIVLR